VPHTSFDISVVVQFEVFGNTRSLTPTRAPVKTRARSTGFGMTICDVRKLYRYRYFTTKRRGKPRGFLGEASQRAAERRPLLRLRRRHCHMSSSRHRQECLCHTTARASRLERCGMQKARCYQQPSSGWLFLFHTVRGAAKRQCRVADRVLRRRGRLHPRARKSSPHWGPRAPAVHSLFRNRRYQFLRECSWRE